ncbi:MAG: glycine zipper 2TM domain-containing protein [Sideroxydans sp.]
MKSSTRNIAFTAFALISLFTLSGCFEEKAKETTAAPAPVVEIAPVASAPVAATPVAAPKPVAKPKPVAPKAAAPAPVKVVCDNCGTVVSINVIEQSGKASGTGVVVGGAIGGLLGNQMADSKNKELATLAGAVGGAIAGNAIEKNMKKTTVVDVAVQMEVSGETRILRHTVNPNVVVGDKVKVENDLVVKQ